MTSDANGSVSALLDRQRDIQGHCFHPHNGFVAFEREEIEQSIPVRFEAQVQRYANRLSIKSGLLSLTYDALNRLANRIARAVLARQGEEEPVALLLDHDADMIAAIMGVLKAGKAYVALDPSYPRARTSHILEDCTATLVVTNTRNLSLAQALGQGAIDWLNIDEIASDTSEENLDLVLSPDRVAYIIYTSGSTGRPKGVFQNHRNLLHNIMQYTNTLHLCSYDRFTLLYSCSVNGSLRDIFGALLNGASVHPYDVRTRGLGGLASWLADEEITFYHSVPTLFRHFMDTLSGEEAFPNVRLIRFGGERVPRKNVELYRKHFPSHCIMYTGMGATETSTVRQFFIDKDTQIESSVVPTGFAVDERDVLILDEEGRELGPNEVGQIVIRSAYLALGYWRRPDLTQEKFKPDPKGGPTRLYYTGDLGRVLPSGYLIHLGRKDFQVKVRGYRIEVAEIEMALMDHQAIKEAAVIAREDRIGTQTLVAYVVSQRGQSPAVNQLNQFLKGRLPEYMIPPMYVYLDEMPLTPNGKIDRRALPEPDQVRPNLESQFVDPRDALEQQLVHIWEGLLDVRPIGVRDNFFDLGGYSLLAMQLVDQIKRLVGKEISLEALFHAPTIEELAEALRREEWSPPFSALVALKTSGAKTPFFCLPGNMGNVYTDLGYLARHFDADRPLYSFQDSTQNFARIETIAARYCEELKVIQPRGPYVLGGVCWGGPVAYEMAQQLQAQHEQVALLVLVEPSRPWKRGVKPYLDATASTLRRLFERFWHHSRQVAQLASTDRGTYTRLKLKVLVNQWATRSYNPKPYSGPLHIVMGSESLDGEYNHRLDWRHWATRGIVVHEIPGNHNVITGNDNTSIEATSMQALAEKLRLLLDGVSESKTEHE